MNGGVKLLGVAVMVGVSVTTFFRGYGKVEARLDAVEEKANQVIEIKKDVSVSQRDIALMQKDIGYIQKDIEEQKSLSQIILEEVRKLK